MRFMTVVFISLIGTSTFAGFQSTEEFRLQAQQAMTEQQETYLPEERLSAIQKIKKAIEISPFDTLVVVTLGMFFHQTLRFAEQYIGELNNKNFYELEKIFTCTQEKPALVKRRIAHLWGQLSQLAQDLEVPLNNLTLFKNTGGWQIALVFPNELP